MSRNSVRIHAAWLQRKTGATTEVRTPVAFVPRQDMPRSLHLCKTLFPAPLSCILHPTTLSALALMRFRVLHWISTMSDLTQTKKPGKLRKRRMLLVTTRFTSEMEILCGDALHSGFIPLSSRFHPLDSETSFLSRHSPIYRPQKDALVLHSRTVPETL